MKSFFAAALLSLVILVSGMISTVHATEPFKVGIVDMIRALNESDAGKRAKTDLEALIKAKQTSIDEKGKAIEKIKADFEKQASAISSEAKKTKEAELERLVRDYQRIVADSQAEIKKKESDLTGDILKELREIVLKTSKDEKFSLVLEQAEGLILYNDKNLDLTEKIITIFNASKKK